MTAFTEVSMRPAVLIREPGDEYADARRRWQGIPGLERVANGRLWAVWYSGGVTEEPGNYLVLATSTDDGVTWAAPCMIVVPPDSLVRCFDPVLWHDPLGRLWLFWAQSEGHFDGRVGVWALRCPDSGLPAPTWSTPRRLANGIMMNKPTMLAGGDWLLPTANWSRMTPLRDDMASERFSNVMASSDQGENWYLRGCADVPDRRIDEHMIVERVDGTLWMLVRTLHGIGEAISYDHGATWHTGASPALPGPNSRFFLRRLHSGRLLLVNHDLHDGWTGVTGQVPVRSESPEFATRSHLTALLSEDDGRTWQGSLLLDAREQVSYPDGVESADGHIYVIYDRERQRAKEILLAVFTEADILAGHPVSPGTRLRALINRATEENSHNQESL